MFYGQNRICSVLSTKQRALFGFRFLTGFNFDMLYYTDEEGARQHARPSIAEKWEREAGYGEQSEVGTDVYKRLHREEGTATQGDEPGIVILRA